MYSGSQDATVRVWDIETKHCKHVLLGHTKDVLCLALVGPALEPDYIASGAPCAAGGCASVREQRV